MSEQPKTTEDNVTMVTPASKISEVQNGDIIGQEKNAKESNSQNDGTIKYPNLLPFCLSYGFALMFSNTLTTYLSSQVTTLEKAFGWSSEKAGVLISGNDIGYLSAALFSNYFLYRFHIPRVLAIAMLIIGTCGALSSLPHLVEQTRMPEYHRYDSNSTGGDSSATNYLCVLTKGNNSTDGTKCGESRNGQDNSSSPVHPWVLYVLFIIFMIQGMAKSVRQALPSVYIDNNSEKVKTGFYIGITNSFLVIGPMLAITLGGVFSKLPIDLKDTQLTPEDPRWLGAWWLGLLMFGGATFLTGLLLFCFSRGRQSPTDKDTNSTYGVTNDEPSFLQQFKDLPRSVLRVVANPLYILTIARTLCHAAAVMIVSAFGPKYVENMFNIPTWKVNFISGGIMLGTTVTGTFLGGVLTRRLRLDVAGCLKLITVAHVIYMAVITLHYQFGCKDQTIYGMEPETRNMRIPGLNTTCDCTGTPFLPVCVDGTSTYYSPCHAGCQYEEESGYSQCTLSATGDVRPGLCDTGCSYFIPYIVSSALASFSATLTLTPTFVVLLRFVDDADRSLALGISSFLMSALVFLPMPIISGKIFDSVCTLWRSHCGVRGSCSLYNLRDMRLAFVSSQFGLLLLGAIAALLVLFLEVRRQKKEKDMTRD